MTAFSAVNYLSNAGRTEAEMKQAFEDNLAATKQLAGAGGAASVLTLASDQITPTSGVHLVETEGGAASDNLAQILQTNLPDGWLLWLTVNTPTHVVVVKHAAGGTGQISLAGAADLSINSSSLWLCLRRFGAVWYEVGRFYGDQTVANRTFYAVAGLGQNTFTGRQEWKQGANLTAAATLTLGTDGNYFHVTGTTAITGISTAPLGTRIALCFESPLQLTHNATSLILSPAQTRHLNWPNETLEFVSEGSGNWREIARGGPYPVDAAAEIVFWDDFEAEYGASGSTVMSRVAWLGNGVATTAYTAPRRHTLKVQSNFVHVRAIAGPISSTTELKLVTAAKLPVLSFAVKAGVPNQAGDTFCVGALDSISYPPTNGIYIRQSGTGNILAACRATNTESATVDCGVTTGGNWHDVAFGISPTAVHVWLDGVHKGTIVTNIPSADLWLGGCANTSLSITDVEFDYWMVRSQR